jgi:hypothetical protein
MVTEELSIEKGGLSEKNIWQTTYLPNMVCLGTGSFLDFKAFASGLEP